MLVMRYYLPGHNVNQNIHFKPSFFYHIIAPDKASFFNQQYWYLFYLNKNTCSRYPQHMFLWKNKKLFMQMPLLSETMVRTIYYRQNGCPIHDEKRKRVLVSYMNNKGTDQPVPSRGLANLQNQWILKKISTIRGKWMSMGNTELG